jgi:hypothetical protein
MTDEELADAWMTLRPTMRQHRRIEARVFASLEASETPLAAEWLELFRVAPFATLGLATVSAVSVVLATPLLSFARALM